MEMFGFYQLPGPSNTLTNLDYSAKTCNSHMLAIQLAQLACGPNVAQLLMPHNGIMNTHLMAAAEN